MIRRVKNRMLDKNTKVSNSQITLFLISIMVGVGILSLPSALARELNNDGWILIIITSIIASIITLIIAFLGRLFPRKTVVEFGKEILTAPVSDFFSIIFLIYFVGLSAFEVRLFAEVVKMFLLTQTPTEVIIITMLLTTTYIVRCGIEELVRMAMIIFPFVIIPTIAIFTFLLPDLDFTNLLPVFRFELSDMIQGIPVAFFSFIGFEFLLLFMAFSEKPKNLHKSGLIAIAVVTFIYLSAFFINLAQFGVDNLRHQLWPMLTLMKAIDIPGAFIENVDAVFMAIWVLAVFTSLGPALFGASLILSKLVRGKEHKYFVLPTIPISYYLSLVPDNLAVLYEYMDIFTNYIGTFIVVVVPIVLFIGALIKGRKKEATKND